MRARIIHDGSYFRNNRDTRDAPLDSSARFFVATFENYVTSIQFDYEDRTIIYAEKHKQNDMEFYTYHLLSRGQIKNMCFQKPLDYEWSWTYNYKTFDDFPEKDSDEYNRLKSQTIITGLDFSLDDDIRINLSYNDLTSGLYRIYRNDSTHRNYGYNVADGSDRVPPMGYFGELLTTGFIEDFTPSNRLNGFCYFGINPRITYGNWYPFAIGKKYNDNNIFVDTINDYTDLPNINNICRLNGWKKSYKNTVDNVWVHNAFYNPSYALTGLMCAQICWARGTRTPQTTSSGSSAIYNMFNYDKYYNYYGTTWLNYFFNDGFGGLADGIKNFDGKWYFDNIHVTENYEEALEYLEKGTPPSDDYYHPVDDSGQPTDDDVPTDPDTNQSDNRDTQNDNTPTANLSNVGGMTHYYLTEGQLKNFMDWFWNRDIDIGELFSQFISPTYGTLSQAIISLKYFPCGWARLATSLDTSSMVIGRYDSELSAQVLTGTPTPKNIGEIAIEKYYKSFLDYEPYTKIMLYLPYYGFMDLSANSVMGRTIKVTNAIDVKSGEMEYTIYADDSIIQTCVCNVSVDIPLTLSDGMEIMKSTIDRATSLMSTGYNLAVGASTGNALSVLNSVQGIYDSTTSNPSGNNLVVKGNQNSNTGVFQPQQMCLILDRPRMKRPSSYGLTVGYPLMRTYKLSNLTGYTKCINVKIKTFSNHFPTNEEYDEIVQLLEQGVIL